MVIFWQWLKAQRRRLEIRLLWIALNDDARRAIVRAMRAELGEK